MFWWTCIFSLSALSAAEVGSLLIQKSVVLKPLQVQGTMFCFKACWQCKLDFRLEHKVALLLHIQSKNTKTNLFVNASISILIKKDSTSSHILPGYRVNGLGIVSNSVSIALMVFLMSWRQYVESMLFLFSLILPVFWRTRVHYENCLMKVVSPKLGLRSVFLCFMVAHGLSPQQRLTSGYIPPKH